MSICLQQWEALRIHSLLLLLYMKIPENVYDVIFAICSAYLFLLCLNSWCKLRSTMLKAAKIFTTTFLLPW